MATLEFEKELMQLLNRHGIDNKVGMPDYVLTNQIVSFLERIETPNDYSVNRREVMNMTMGFAIARRAAANGAAYSQDGLIRDSQKDAENLLHAFGFKIVDQ